MSCLDAKRFRSRLITSAPHGHILANRNVWSADGEWLVYDLRNDETIFSGDRIERVHVQTGEVQVLYRSPPGGNCGVPSCSPVDDRIVLIQGPIRAGRHDDWEYLPSQRHGMIGSAGQSDSFEVLDARDLVPPFTAGALRGGTHLHMFSPNGTKVASTYEDHLLATASRPGAQSNRRVIAISWLDRATDVPQTHRHNQNGVAFTVVATNVHESPQPETSQFFRAYSEAWLNDHRIVFQADVARQDSTGHIAQHTELFVLEVPTQLTWDNDEHVSGTITSRPEAPHCFSVRRLTWTDHDRWPGVRGPRHWAVASPDERWIGCYRIDRSAETDAAAQFCIVDVGSGEIHQITRPPFNTASALTWHPDSKSIICVSDGSVFQVPLDGEPIRLSERTERLMGPTHHACVFSPQGDRIAYLQPVRNQRGVHLQIHCLEYAD